MTQHLFDSPRFDRWRMPRRFISCVGCLALLAGLFVAPASARQQANVYDKFRERERGKGAMSLDQELKFAEAAHQEIAKTNKFITDREVVNYINTIGKNIAARSGRPDLPYQFYVIDNNQINAFTPGGGRIYIYSGLMKSTTTEGQLVAVLAHEIGHNVGYHISDQIREQQKYGLFAGIIGAVLGRGIAGDFGRLATGMLANGFLFKRSRDAEREADYLGLYDMRDAGYNTDEMNNMFRLLASLGKQPGAIDKVFASHPPATERLGNTEREIRDHLVGSDRRGVRSSDAFARVQRILPEAASGAAPGGEPGGAPPSQAGDARADAERVLAGLRNRDARYQNARVIGAEYGNATGRSANELVVVYDSGGSIGAFVYIDTTPFDLTTDGRTWKLPLRDLVRLNIRPGDAKTKTQVRLVSNDRLGGRRRDTWEWTGRGFRYVGGDFRD